MKPLSLIVALATGFGLTWLLTDAFRRFAIRTHLVDHPNTRSSHATPTPRGGGMAFVATTLATVLALAANDPSMRRLAVALFGGGLLVAVLGYVDDRRHLPARWRLLGHVIAGSWLLMWMEPIPPVPIFGVAVSLGALGIALSLLHVVWMINLSNFMDGIDGIASTQAITTSVGGALVWWLAAPGDGWMVSLGLAACVGGFLVWNWPPARIFMGDSGSGFLGYMLGALSLWCGQAAPTLFWAWFLLFGCFMVDATTTLVRRIARGLRFDEPHRTHAYQFASRVHGSHRLVTLTVCAINLVWLLPWSVAVALGKCDGVTGTLIAYAPLVWLALRYHAGDGAAQAA